MEFKLDHASRVVITGNSGSGKSHVAGCLAQTYALRVIDLDQIYWMETSYGSKRDDAVARDLVEKAAAQLAWVIEGVFGALCRIALQNATALIWLDLPWDECRAGLMQRGLRRSMTEADHAELVAWAAAYWTRQNANSHAGHLRLFDAFDGPKMELKNRSEVDQFVAKLNNQPAPARLDPPAPGS
jgi:adenylate kinase family enzyme